MQKERVSLYMVPHDATVQLLLTIALSVVIDYCLFIVDIRDIHKLNSNTARFHWILQKIKLIHHCQITVPLSNTMRNINVYALECSFGPYLAPAKVRLWFLIYFWAPATVTSTLVVVVVFRCRRRSTRRFCRLDIGAKLFLGFFFCRIEQRSCPNSVLVVLSKFLEKWQMVPYMKNMQPIIYV